MATCLTKSSTTSWVARSHLAKRQSTERGQAAVEFALILPFLVLAIASLLYAALLIRDQLALWHGAYAGAYAASLEPTNHEAIRQAVVSESGFSSVTVTTTQNDRYITVQVTTARTIPLLLLSQSIRLFPLHADVTMHVQDVGG